MMWRMIKAAKSKRTNEIYNVGTKPRGNPKFRKLEHIPGKSSLDPNVKTWSKLAKSFGMEIHYHNRSRLNHSLENGAAMV